MATPRVRSTPRKVAMTSFEQTTAPSSAGARTTDEPAEHSKNPETGRRPSDRRLLSAGGHRAADFHGRTGLLRIWPRTERRRRDRPA